MYKYKKLCIIKCTIILYIQCKPLNENDFFKINLGRLPMWKKQE